MLHTIAIYFLYAAGYQLIDIVALFFGKKFTTTDLSFNLVGAALFTARYSLKFSYWWYIPFMFAWILIAYLIKVEATIIGEKRLRIE